MGTEFLRDFKVGIYKFILEAGAQGMELPPFYGSTLRGAFGGAFKRIACANPSLPSCHRCDLEQSCPYAYIFETSPSPETERLKSYEDIPRPFMFCPKLKDKTFYAPGQIFEVELRLFGRGNDFFPYFVLAFTMMGERGLGARRKPFHLKKVIGLNPLSRLEQVVYDGVSNKVIASKCIIEGKEIFMNLSDNIAIYHGRKQNDQFNSINTLVYASNSANHTQIESGSFGETNESQVKYRIRVRFSTPIRIKENGNLVTTVEFHHLVRSLMRRASSVMYFHHGINMDFDYTGLAARSRLPKRVADITSWYDIERYSQRQGGKMKLGGVVGEVTYEGDLAEFIPFLEFGRWCGVGKNCVFGLGQMDYEALD